MRNEFWPELDTSLEDSSDSTGRTHRTCLKKMDIGERQAIGSKEHKDNGWHYQPRQNSSLQGEPWLRRWGGMLNLRSLGNCICRCKAGS